jgi:hypothetical protein
MAGQADLHRHGTPVSTSGDRKILGMLHHHNLDYAGSVIGNVQRETLLGMLGFPLF